MTPEKKLFHGLLALFAMVAMKLGSAAGNADFPVEGAAFAADPEYSVGIISDETLSPFGHELAREIGAKWLLDGGRLNGSLVIKEKPAPALGSLIQLWLNGQLVFSRHYQTRRADTGGISHDLVVLIKDRLAAREVEAMVVSPDLQGDGF